MSKFKPVPLKGVVPNDEYLDGETPTVTWNGAEWPVPLLAPKQNRHVLPAVMRSKVTIADMKTAKLSEEQFDDLLGIVYWGLKRAHPTLTREQFDDVPFSMNDVMKASEVVARQTGAMAEQPKGAGDDTTQGEAQVEDATKSPQTGTQ